MGKHSKEYVNEFFEIKASKSKGQEHCHIYVVGEEENIITGLSCLIDTVLNKLGLNKEMVLYAIDLATGRIKEEEEKKKIKVKEIHIDGEDEEELDRILKKIMKGDK